MSNFIKNQYEKVHQNEEDNNQNTSSDLNFRSTISGRITTIFSLVMLILSVIFYLFTLQGCSGTQADCLKDFDQSKVKMFALILFSSSFLFTLNILLYLFKFIDYFVPSIQIVVVAFLCFIYDNMDF